MKICILISPRGILDKPVADVVSARLRDRGNAVELKETDNAHLSAGAAFRTGVDAVVVLANQMRGSYEYGMYVPGSHPGRALFDARSGFQNVEAMAEHIETRLGQN